MTTWRFKKAMVAFKKEGSGLADLREQQGTCTSAMGEGCRANTDECMHDCAGICAGCVTPYMVRSRTIFPALSSKRLLILWTPCTTAKYGPIAEWNLSGVSKVDYYASKDYTFYMKLQAHRKKIMAKKQDVLEGYIFRRAVSMQHPVATSVTAAGVSWRETIDMMKQEAGVWTKLSQEKVEKGYKMWTKRLDEYERAAVGLGPGATKEEVQAAMQIKKYWQEDMYSKLDIWSAQHQNVSCHRMAKIVGQLL